MWMSRSIFNTEKRRNGEGSSGYSQKASLGNGADFPSQHFPDIPEALGYAEPQQLHGELRYV